MTGDSGIPPAQRISWGFELGEPQDGTVYFPLHPDDKAQLTRIEDKLDQILAKLHGPRGEVP